MSRARIVAAIVIVAALGAGSWRLFARSGGDGSLAPPAAHLAIRWRGRYRGTMTLPARINWCPGTRQGILEAISADSGVAVVLYERDSLTSGPHVVGAPATVIAPPGAAVVMRWMRIGRDTAVAGFQSRSGTVRTMYAGGKGSGDINARMQMLTGTDTLVVEGSFRDLPVVTTAAGCS